MNMNGVTRAHCLVEVFPSAILPSPTLVLAMGRINRIGGQLHLF